MLIKSVVFKKDKDSKWESGIMLVFGGRKHSVIYDVDGNKINPLTTHDDSYWINLNVNPLLEDMCNHYNN